MGIRRHRLATAFSVGLAGVLVTVMMVFGLSIANVGAATPNLQSLVVRSGDMPGFAPAASAPKTATSLAGWVKIEGLRKGGTQILDLRKDGFVGALDEGLSPTPGSPEGYGDSAVWFFKTPAGAREYAAYLYVSGIVPSDLTVKYQSIDVGVSGARSYVGTTSTGASANTYFAVGRCAVWIADYLPGSDKGSPSATSPVVAGAKAVDVHDRGACK